MSGGGGAAEGLTTAETTAGCGLFPKDRKLRRQTKLLLKILSMEAQCKERDYHRKLQDNRMQSSINKATEELTKPATISDLLDLYFRETVLRPASKETYRTAVHMFMRDTKINGLEAVTHETILSWRDLVIQRASLSTWNTYRRGMKTLFNFAVRNGWLENNLFLGVKQISLVKRKKTVSKRILNEVLMSLKSDASPVNPGWFWSAAFKLLYYTGMRRRQLCALRWRDIDFDRKTILLSIEGSKTKREWDIPLPKQCEEDLRHLWHESKARRERLEACQVFWIQLFTTRYSGHELHPDQVTNAFLRLSKHLDITVSPHRLRHTMATDLATGQNPDLKSLQYLLGHSNLSVTLEYVAPEMSQLRGQLAKLDMEGTSETD